MVDVFDQMLEEVRVEFRGITTSQRHTKKARVIALNCLECVPEKDGKGWDMGLGPVIAQYKGELEDLVVLNGVYSSLISELHGLRAAFRKLVRQIRRMSPETIVWVDSTWSDEIGTPAYDKVCSLRRQGGAGPEVFPMRPGESTALVVRLEALAELMKILSRQAKEASAGTPKARVFFEQESPDHAMLRRVAQVLAGRGYSLRYLRPIAAAIYTWGHGHQPPPTWADRFERTVRKRLLESQGDELDSPEHSGGNERAVSVP